MLNNTQDYDEYLFRQVSTCTGHCQLQYSIAQMCTREDTRAHKIGLLYVDDVMSYNWLTTSLCPL